MPAYDTGGVDAAAEHAIVIRLREDHTQPVLRRELYAIRPDIGAARLDNAIISLTEAQVVRAEGNGVRSAPALQRLDDLRLIAI
jgi:hypothetical protein